jgi:hypothetical protein
MESKLTYPTYLQDWHTYDDKIIDCAREVDSINVDVKSLRNAVIIAE